MQTTTSWLSKLLYFTPYSIRPYINKIPGLAWAQRNFISLFGPKGEFYHYIDFGPAKGLTIPIRLPLDKGMWKGTYEIKFCQQLASFVTAEDICFDIGAYRGYTSGVLAVSGAKEVFAFEPVPENQMAILKLKELNKNLPITLIPKAVSEKDGIQQLYISKDSSMNSLEYGSELVVDKRIDVETVSLDVISRTLGHFPDIIKIDVEGAEESVICGGIDVLKKNVKVVFLEIHHLDAEIKCRQMLDDLGFLPCWKEKDWGCFANQVVFKKK